MDVMNVTLLYDTFFDLNLCTGVGPVLEVTTPNHYVRFYFKVYTAAYWFEISTTDLTDWGDRTDTDKARQRISNARHMVITVLQARGGFFDRSVPGIDS